MRTARVPTPTHHTPFPSPPPAERGYQRAAALAPGARAGEPGVGPGGGALPQAAAAAGGSEGPSSDAAGEGGRANGGEEMPVRAINCPFP